MEFLAEFLTSPTSPWKCFTKKFVPQYKICSLTLGYPACSF
jgi:hypothetical protein